MIGPFGIAATVLLALPTMAAEEIAPASPPSISVQAVRVSSRRPGAMSASAQRADGRTGRGPFFVTPDENLADDLNDFWHIYGLGLYQDNTTPMLGGRKWWGIPVSASDGDWTELKLAWHDDPATRRTLRQWLLQLPIDSNGYVWAAADGRKHLNLHQLWHTNADFINALWEYWRWDGDPAALHEAPDYAVGVAKEDGSAQTLHDATDFVHYIHGDGMSLSQTFRSPAPFRSARARLAVQARSNYELRLYADDAAEPVARQTFTGLAGFTNGWTSLMCTNLQPAGAYRLELRNLGRFYQERIGWIGSERDRYPDGVSGQNGLVNLSELERARRALAFLLDNSGMRGRADGIVTIPDPDHDGTPQPTERRSGASMPSTYYDLVRSGGREAFVNLRYLKALDSMAQLEDAAGDPARAQACRDQLKRARAVFHRTFWSAKTGRYVGWIDTHGATWDYGEVEVNLLALRWAAPPPAAAKSILDWISGRRIVAGDTSQGADLYHWKFAPRKNTLAYESLGATNHWWGGWFWDFRPDGSGRGNFGHQEENGGTNPLYAYDDVMARLQCAGADDAWERFAGPTNSVMAEFHKDHLRRPTAADPNHPGERYKAYVLDLPEAGLPPLVILHGFLGVQPDGRVLRIHPHLPTGVRELGVRDIGFRGRAYAITARADGSVIVQAEHGDATKLELVAGGFPANAPCSISITSADGKPIRSTTVTSDAGGEVAYTWSLHDGEQLSIRH